jgi:hypothetical protein
VGGHGSEGGRRREEGARKQIIGQIKYGKMSRIPLLLLLLDEMKIRALIKTLHVEQIKRAFTCVACFRAKQVISFQCQSRSRPILCKSKIYRQSYVIDGKHR